MATWRCEACGATGPDAVSLIRKARVKHPEENALDLVREAAESVERELGTLGEVWRPRAEASLTEFVEVEGVGVGEV